jgi:hypothetical protein
MNIERIELDWNSLISSIDSTQITAMSFREQGSQGSDLAYMDIVTKNHPAPGHDGLGAHQSFAGLGSQFDEGPTQHDADSTLDHFLASCEEILMHHEEDWQITIHAPSDPSPQGALPLRNVGPENFVVLHHVP